MIRKSVHRCSEKIMLGDQFMIRFI